MVQKNVAGQKFALKALDMSAGSGSPGVPKTGDAANITPYVSKNFGVLTAISSPSLTEMDATNAPGWYKFNLSQGETTADQLLFTAVSSTGNHIVFQEQVVIPVPPYFSDPWIETGGSGILVGSSNSVNVGFNADKTGYSLSSAGNNSAADALLDRADAIETGWTFRKALRILLAVLGGKASGLPGSPVYRNAIDTKDRITATTDANGNRSAVTLDGT